MSRELGIATEGDEDRAHRQAGDDGECALMVHMPEAQEIKALKKPLTLAHGELRALRN
ncbi:MAG: hypothetical protein IPP44_15705 [Ideonella sp.]|nr:hypothetical protein [Ideonella sp.]